MNVSMWREEVVHDNKVNLLAIRHLDAVEAVKLREERIWVLFDVIIVILENLSQKLVFGVMNRLDNVLVVSGKIEEAAALAGRPKLG